jgi:hypothetical protein
MLLLFSLFCASALFASTAHAQTCTGQGYFKPDQIDGLQFAQVSSRSSGSTTLLQTNCIALVNTGPTTQTQVSASFSFESIAQGDFEILTTFSQPVTGSVATTCSTSRRTPSGAQVVAEIAPASGALGPNQVAGSCCFVHQAQVPTNLCESLPGEGDVFTVMMDANGGPTQLTAGAIPPQPQQPACGLVGLEVLLALAPAWVARRQRRRPKASHRAAAAKTIAVAVPFLALATLAPADAHAADFSIAKGTDVDLLLTAFAEDTGPLTLSGTAPVDVTFSGFAPATIDFQGGALSIADITLTAAGPAGSVTATLTNTAASITSGTLTVGAGGTFDASAVTVTIDDGMLSVGGAVFAQAILGSRDLSTTPAPLANDPATQGTITVTPSPQGTVLSITLPLELCVSLSSDSGASWLIVEGGTLTLEATLPGEPVPALGGSLRWLLLALLPGVAWLAERRLRTR